MIELARMLCGQAAQPAGRSTPRYFLVELDVVLAGDPTPASVTRSLSPPELISIEVCPSLRQSLTPSFSGSAIPVHIPRTLHPKLSLPPPLPDISTVAVAWSISVFLTHSVVAGPVRRA